jgi:hypothetical protein
MQPIRLIYDHAPPSIPVPTELRDRRVELILWPLGDTEDEPLRPAPRFNIAQVERIEVPSREERNARR